jgi:hypothetical protein
MSRSYDVVFNTPKGYVETRGYGNVRRTALRSATHRLKDMGFDPKQCSVHSIAPTKHKENSNG